MKVESIYQPNLWHVDTIIYLYYKTLFQGQNKDSERLLEPLYSAGLNEYTLYLYVFMLLSRYKKIMLTAVNLLNRVGFAEVP